jgi:DnaK suppressor protein
MKATGQSSEQCIQSIDLLINSLKDSLLTQKASILNKSHEFKSEQSNVSTQGDEAEIASLDANTSISIHLHERDRTALYSIEKALGKISEGSYGQCDSCGEMIAARRLQARPFTSYCIDCMEEQESRSPLFQ